MACFSAINPSSVSLLLQSSTEHFTKSKNCVDFSRIGPFHRSPVSLHCTGLSTPTLVSDPESEYEEEEEYDSSSNYAEDEGQVPRTISNGHPPPVRRRLRRYRKEYPGEKKGVTEEMRFVAMKLRNNKKGKGKDSDGDKGDNFIQEDKDDDTWQPSVDGFLKYLVDSRLVFTTVERIVDESADVSYVYFRKTGLERSDYLSRDLEWFRQQGNVIPEASNPGTEYARYLEELAETSPPLFLSHLYNIYFSHIVGGQVIAKQVSEKLLQGKELELHRWDDGDDAEELLKAVREKLNALGVHWSRDEKTKCLRETTKAFRALGQIISEVMLSLPNGGFGYIPFGSWSGSMQFLVKKPGYCSQC